VSYLPPAPEMVTDWFHPQTGLGWVGSLSPLFVTLFCMTNAATDTT